MLPARVAEGLKNSTKDLIDLCRQHSWAELTSPPDSGMRSIHEILVHLIDAEGGWINHVVRGHPRHRFKSGAFGSLDQIAKVWAPQRQETILWMQGLTTDERLSVRPLPWNAEEKASVEEILWHFVTHEHYHRGQIFTRLALLGRRDLPDHDLLRQGATS
ncbi:MAG TPA: DinB family protein [Gemmataceae bacterium]|nr:DinB family protein [Gemmataceae bacterium]